MQPNLPTLRQQSLSLENACNRTGAVSLLPRLTARKPPGGSVADPVRSGLNRKQLLLLLLLTLGALLVHGYHPWAEDAEIYLPGVEKLLHSELFPFGAEFFQSHASLTIFPNLLAALVRATHLPLEQGLFFVHLASIFLLLLAC